MAELEELVADKILQIIKDDVPEVTTRIFDQVRIAADDFREHELPAVQLWDLSQIITHVRSQEEVAWRIVLELIMKPLTATAVDQKALWALRRKIEVALWDKPNLGIPGVKHLLYISNLTDLHLLAPWYVARMEFDVLFRRDLTGSC